MKQLAFITPVPGIPNPQKQPKNPSCLLVSTTHLEKYMMRQNGLVHLPPQIFGVKTPKISEYYHHLQQAKPNPNTPQPHLRKALLIGQTHRPRIRLQQQGTKQCQGGYQSTGPTCWGWEGWEMSQPPPPPTF